MPSLPRSPVFCIFFFFLQVCLVEATALTSFTDATCTRSWRALDAVNGYPDGLCKPLNLTAGQSFQIQRLDEGCAGTCAAFVKCCLYWGISDGR